MNTIEFKPTELTLSMAHLIECSSADQPHLKWNRSDGTVLNCTELTSRLRTLHQVCVCVCVWVWQHLKWSLARAATSAGAGGQAGRGRRGPLPSSHVACSHALDSWRAILTEGYNLAGDKRAGAGGGPCHNRRKHDSQVVSGDEFVKQRLPQQALL